MSFSEVAFFSDLLKNVTQNVKGYEIDGNNRDLVIKSFPGCKSFIMLDLKENVTNGKANCSLPILIARGTPCSEC